MQHACQWAHDSTIAGSARLSVYYRVMLLSGRARDYRFVGSARGQPEVVIRVLRLFSYFIFMYSEQTYSTAPRRLEPNPGSGRSPAVRVVRNF